ncbi:alpha/beta hydrolase [Flavobacterium sp. MAH-1]|uniref:Alpha/beta hydrolase n=2 Tax=Flavobacterium agri TaxID=2743471 RepID=A0A7Y8Y1N8_9FLAO|nr:alpha/beta hydrolase [Flavobacterium agri]NYA70777.1 alpha/beta hydrolase [Flavobacterium agri]
MRIRFIAILIVGIGCAFFNIAYAQNPSAIKNVVLVHGAFVDGSGWRDVYQSLTQKGYKVSVTQHKLQDFDEDVAEVNRIIDQQDGPCILVGHSYGGVVITQAGNNPKVVGLVYIAAHAPDDGELRADLVKTYPPASTSIIKGNDGLDYITPEKFPADFAADLPIDQARFMANSQVPTADKVFRAAVHNAAWKTKPSWYMVAKSDRIINPDLERFYAKRAKSVTVEAEGASHSVFISQAPKVAELIILATKTKK